MSDRESVERNANDFVNDIRQLMNSIPLSAIVNADQSGVLKELHTARTLAATGCRTVECVVQSVSATTHSYTILPMISADGLLGSKLYVVLQEPHGQFPQQGHFTASNLVVDCHTSHMMTKELMMNWLTTCVLTENMPDRMLLIVDSWSSFKDHATIQSLAPRGKTLLIRNIPPGATSKIQPLDVYFFIVFKGYIKRFTNYVSSNQILLHLSKRDTILKMLSLIYNQFCAPQFRHFLQYSWYACGYVTEHPTSFLTPVQYCFSLDAIKECNIENCDKISFIKCAFCEKCLCFEHFYTSYHYH